MAYNAAGVILNCVEKSPSQGGLARRIGRGTISLLVERKTHEALGGSTLNLFVAKSDNLQHAYAVMAVLPY